jgi:sulfite reductase beta subunit-like hemoprotein
LAHPLAGTLAAVGGCRGATVCRLAVTKAENMAEELRVVLQNMVAAEDLRGATLWISGCPNACGRHHVATIGLHGAAKKIDGKTAPYYHLMIGGGIDAQGAHFGRTVGRIPARRVPRAVRRLIAFYREFHDDGEKFETYLQRVETETVCELLADLMADEVRDGEENFFVDWGDVAPFRIVTGSSDCA